MPPKSKYWSEVIVAKGPYQHGNFELECKHCHLPFNGSSFRIQHHLAGSGSGISSCQMCPAELQEAAKAELKQKHQAKGKKRQLQALGTSKCALEVVDLGAKPQKKKVTVKSLFAQESKLVIDKALAKFFYSTGTPFDRVRSPYFRAMLDAVARYGPSYKHPNVNQLREALLDATVVEVDAEIANTFLDCLPLTKGTLASDGWSSSDNRPLLNVMLVTPKGAYFRESIDTFRHTKNAEYVVEQLCSGIERAGLENIVQVIMDGAAVCIAAGRILEERYEHITFARCAAYTLDLLLEDICSRPWIKQLKEQAMKIIHFLTRHHASQAFYRNASSAQSKGLQFLKPAETRFAFTFVVVDRLIEVWGALEALMVDRAYKMWSEQAKYEDKADEIRAFIQDRKWWKNLEAFSKLCVPIVRLLRSVDSDQPMTSKIYHSCYALSEHVQGLELDSADKEYILERITARWNNLHSEMNSAGYALDPEFWDHDYSSNDEVITGLNNMFSKLLPEREAATASLQHARFKAKEGLFGTMPAKKNASQMHAWQWWKSYGAGVPEVQEAAIQILAQCCSACSCERNWSTYNFIHFKSRNKLQVRRASDLVYVFSNLTLLD